MTRRAGVLSLLLVACGARSPIDPGAGGAPTTTASGGGATATTSSTSSTSTTTSSSTGGAPVACPKLSMFPPLHEVSTAGVDMDLPVAVSVGAQGAAIVHAERSPATTELWSASIDAWGAWPPPNGVTTAPFADGSGPLSTVRGFGVATALDGPPGSLQLAYGEQGGVTLRGALVSGSLGPASTSPWTADVLAVAAPHASGMRLALAVDEKGRMLVVRAPPSGAPSVTPVGCSDLVAAGDVIASGDGFIVAIALGGKPTWDGDPGCATPSNPTAIHLARADADGSLVTPWTTVDGEGIVARVRLSPTSSGGAWLAWTRIQNSPPRVMVLDASLASGAVPGWSTGANDAEASALALAPLGDDAILAVKAQIAGTESVDVYHLRADGIGLDSYGIFPGTQISHPTAASEGGRAIVAWSESATTGAPRSLRIAAFHCEP